MLDVCCALIYREGCLLAVQRHADTDHPNQWEFPGGKVEPGESAVACIKREIQEELGVTVWVEAFLYPVTHDYGNKQIKLYPFVCSIQNANIDLYEHQQLVWLRHKDLDALDWQEADRELINLNHLCDLQRFWENDENRRE